MRLIVSAAAGALVAGTLAASASGTAPPGTSEPTAMADPCAPADASMTSEPVTSEPATELPAWYTLPISDVDGHTFALADCVGTPVLVELFATWCSKCREQLPKTEAAAVAMGDAAVFVVLSVETDLSPDAVAQYREQHELAHMRFAVLTDEHLAAFVEAFGNTAANPPSTPKIVIDAMGHPSELATGQENAEDLVAKLTAAGAATPATTTG